MTENEFTLEDRIAKIQAINNEYNLEQNAYISFSGGKDSCVLSKLIDLALPNNHIPRVYFNTGIEYIDMVKFVKSIKDNRIIIVNSNVNIRKMLNEYGYPFKSKEHSLRVDQFNKGTNKNYIKKYINGYDVNGKESSFVCPEILKYQFQERNKYHYSSQCCFKLKKDVAHRYAKESNRKITITGMRASEGGNRKRLGCTIFNENKLTKFHPLIVVSEEWEEWFIKEYSIELCKLYYPPYNFKRTGCRNCPYALDLEQQLLTCKDLLPIDFNASMKLWKPVYDEYVRLGYRLPKDFYIKIKQMKLKLEE